MKTLLEFKHPVMSIGLIPMIVGMILCIFFADAVVLYICNLANIIYIIYRYIKPPHYYPNLVLLHGSISMFIVAVMKYVGGEWIIPDKTVPITLEILMLCLALLYQLTPGTYKSFFSFFHCHLSIVNHWALKIIAFLSGIHLFSFCIILLFFNPLSHKTLYFMGHIIPPLLYIACIVINYAFIIAVALICKKKPCLRIAPICNGKIYVAPRNYLGEEPGKWDIPMEDYIYTTPIDSDQYAKEIGMKFKEHITGEVEPRFSLKYLVKLNKGTYRTILLYILPLNDEKQIYWYGAKFITPEEIKSNLNKYSSFLKEEIDHLSMAAQLWNKFK